MICIEDLKSFIDDVDVVSFDVFDTLLLRHHYHPTDLFSEISLFSLPVAPRFQRIAGEYLSRLKNRHEEDVSLQQIYSLLPGSGKSEIAAELRSVCPNQDVTPILAYAVSQGKRVIAVSDMYLPRETILSLLQAAGINICVNNIFVSCEFGTTKASGGLYKLVCQRLEISPNRILHIGDNFHSDYQQALHCGLNSLHLPTRREKFEANNPLHPELFNFLSDRRRPIFRLILGLNRDRFHDVQSRRDYWYVLGYSTLGPIANAFAEWVFCRAKCVSADKIYFLARDGALPNRVFQLRYPNIQSCYTIASRRLFLLPCLAEGVDEVVIDGLSGGLPGTSAEEYWHRLDIRSSEVDMVHARHFHPGERILSLTDHLRLRAFFREVIPILRPFAEEEKRKLYDYLSSIGMLSENSSPLLIDVGWRASSQRYLEKAFPQLKGIAGGYLGLEQDAYDNGNMSAFFFHGTNPRLHHRFATHCIEILELMFSSPEPSARKLESNGEKKFSPVFETCSPEDLIRAKAVSALHQGALDFTKDLLRLEEKGYDIHLNAEDVKGFLGPVMMCPTLADIEHIGRIPHALGLGNSRYETLLPNHLPKSPTELLRQLVGPQRRKLYWPRGVTRGIAFRHGVIAGLGARCVLTSYLILLRVRNLIYQLIPR